MKKVNGCGNRVVNGRWKVLEGTEHLELLTVCDIIQNCAHAAVNPRKVPVHTTSVELAKRKDLNVAIISTPAGGALEAMRQGEHFIGERTLSNDTSAAFHPTRQAELALDLDPQKTEKRITLAEFAGK